jgi:hypothetical protein
MLTGEKLAGLEVRVDHLGLLSRTSIRFAGRIPVEIGSRALLCATASAAAHNRNHPVC